MDRYVDPKVVEAMQSRMAKMPTRDLLRLLRGGPRGQHIGADLEAAAQDDAQQALRQERRARRWRLLWSYFPWLALAGVVVLFAIQVGGLQQWAADQGVGIPWSTSQVLVREMGGEGIIVQRPTGQETTRLLLLDPPSLITINDERISLAETSGWISLDLGMVNDVELNLAGVGHRYQWTNTGWQKTN